MSIAKEKSLELTDYEILFKDSNEYFCVEKAKMIQEGVFVRFICFESQQGVSTVKENVWFPIANIHRIKSYAK